MTQHFRCHARKPVHLACTLRRVGSDASRAFGLRHLPAIVRDLGLGGARVECDEPLVVGERIELLLPVATRWEPLALAGVIAWTHPPCFLGVSFAGLDDEPQLAESLPLVIEAMYASRTTP